jgi:hypothetical protein
VSAKYLAFSAAILIALTPAAAPAQSVLAAHSGTLHYFEGDVRIDGIEVQTKPGRFDEIKEQSVLSTGMGNAEVLLTPGAFLRLGQQSSIRMLDNRLVSTRLDILSGNVSVEADHPDLSVKDSPVTLLYRNYEIHPVKHGLFEIGTNPAQMKVYQGEVIVANGNDKVSVREGRMISFNGALLTEKFNSKKGDGLLVWSRDRSQFLSAANIASARDVGSAFSGSNWYFNAYFGAFTFIPARGTLWNPWGYGFFSPNTIRYYYVPVNYANGGNRNPGAANPGVARGGSAPVQTAALPGQRGMAPANANAPSRATNMPVAGSPIRSGANVGAAPPPPAPQSKTNAATSPNGR